MKFASLGLVIFVIAPLGAYAQDLAHYILPGELRASLSQTMDLPVKSDQDMRNKATAFLQIADRATSPKDRGTVIAFGCQSAMGNIMVCVRSGAAKTLLDEGIASAAPDSLKARMYSQRASATEIQYLMMGKHPACSDCTSESMALPATPGSMAKYARLTQHLSDAEYRIVRHQIVADYAEAIRLVNETVPTQAFQSPGNPTVEPVNRMASQEVRAEQNRGITEQHNHLLALQDANELLAIKKAGLQKIALLYTIRTPDLHDLDKAIGYKLAGPEREELLAMAGNPDAITSASANARDDLMKARGMAFHSDVQGTFGSTQQETGR